MKRVGVLVDFNYQELEVWYPLLRFKEAGYETFTIGSEGGKNYTSRLNYPCVSDCGIDDVSHETLDALVIPGGWCPDLLRKDKRIVELVRNMMQANKPVGSVCRGASLLCTAKCVTGRHLTCFESIKDDVEHAGGLYEDSPVVTDGNLVTSRLPADLPYFCKALLDLISTR